MDFTRRAFLAASTGAASMSWFESALGQSKDPSTEKLLSTNVEQVSALRTRVQNAGFGMNRDSATTFLNSEGNLRRELVKLLRSIPSERLSGYVLPEQREIAVHMLVVSASLLPAQEVRPVLLQPQAAISKCSETTLAVLVDVILQGLDLQPLKDAFIQVVQKTPELEKLFNDLATSVRLRDSKQVIDVVTKIFEFVSKVGMLDLVVRALGREAANRTWQGLLKKLGERCVPFVGQIYMVLSVAVALFANVERLMATINCQPK